MTRLLFFVAYLLGYSTSVRERASRFINSYQIESTFYILDGFRNSFFDGSWFFEDITYTLYFWAFTLLLLTVGSVLHMKFRDRFVDFL